MTDPPVRPSPPWADRLAGWRETLPPLPVPGLALAGGALVLVAATVVAVALLISRGSSPAAPVVLPRADAGAPGSTGPDATSGGGGGGGRSGGAGGGGQPTTVTVHAAGAVAHPGIYVLPAEARVADVVSAAGGASPEADVDQLNLATKVGDGDRVYLPRRGETPPVPPAGAAPAGAGTGPAATRAATVDLNAGDASQLESLPGIGPALAAAIVEHRARNGRFRSVDDLLDVPGIGPAKLATLRPLVRV